MAKDSSLAELAAVLAVELAAISQDKPTTIHPAWIARDAAELLRLGRGFSRRAVMACNGVSRWSPEHNRTINGWSDADEAAKTRADAKAAKQAAEIAATYGATIRTGGDPRGYVLRLILQSGRTNGWGEGWGVA